MTGRGQNHLHGVLGCLAKVKLCTLSLHALTPPFWGLVRVFWLNSDPVHCGSCPGTSAALAQTLHWALAVAVGSAICRLSWPPAEPSVALGPAPRLACVTWLWVRCGPLCILCLAAGERDSSRAWPLGLLSPTEWLRWVRWLRLGHRGSPAGRERITWEREPLALEFPLSLPEAAPDTLREVLGKLTHGLESM